MKHDLEVYLPMRKACEILGVVPITLRRWEKAGKIKAIRTPSGQRRYARSEILRLLGENQPEGVRAVIYARVSSAKQAGEGNLERQKQRLERHAQEKGYEIKAVIAEQGSGLNEKRKGLDSRRENRPGSNRIQRQAGPVRLQLHRKIPQRFRCPDRNRQWGRTGIPSGRACC